MIKILIGIVVGCLTISLLKSSGAPDWAVWMTLVLQFCRFT